MIERFKAYADILTVHSLAYLKVAAPQKRRHDFSCFLLDDTGDDAGADGATAFTDREAQTFIHDRRDQIHLHRDVAPGITTVPSGSSTEPVTSVVRK